MYCTKCGKWIDYEATVCNECRAAEEVASAAAENREAEPRPDVSDMFTPAPFEIDPKNRMFGFGKALTSAILGFFGFLFSYIALVAGIIEPGAGIVLFILGLPPTIISIIFGIQSIKAFKKRSANGCAKPIATLVLGIHGVALGATAAFFLLIALIAISVGGVSYSDSYYY